MNCPGGHQHSLTSSTVRSCPGVAPRNAPFLDGVRLDGSRSARVQEPDATSGDRLKELSTASHVSVTVLNTSVHEQSDS